MSPTYPQHRLPILYPPPRRACCQRVASELRVPRAPRRSPIDSRSHWALRSDKMALDAGSLLSAEDFFPRCRVTSQAPPARRKLTACVGLGRRDPPAAKLKVHKVEMHRSFRGILARSRSRLSAHPFSLPFHNQRQGPPSLLTSLACTSFTLSPSIDLSTPFFSQPRHGLHYRQGSFSYTGYRSRTP